MPKIEITIKNKIAQSPQEKIICGNGDYIISFDFDSEWNSYDVKTARFYWSGGFADVVFSGTECPAPILSNVTSCAVGVYSGEGNAEDAALKTTTPAFLSCERSILCFGGIEHEAPPDDVYNQIISMLNATSAEVEQIEGGARIKITDVHGNTTEATVLNGADGEPGAPLRPYIEQETFDSMTVEFFNDKTGEVYNFVVLLPKGEKGDPGEDATLTEGSVTTSILADKAVTLEKTAFVVDALGKNLLDPSKLTKGRLTASGTIGSKSDQSVCDYIEIDPALSYVLSFKGQYSSVGVKYRFAFYDESKNHIAISGASGVDLYATKRVTFDGVIYSFVDFGQSGQYTIPANARYIRVSTGTGGFPLMQFECGENPSSFSEYGMRKRFDGVDALSSADIVDSLDSKDEKKVLSAKQGANLYALHNQAAPKKLKVTLSDDGLKIAGKIGKKQTVQIEGNLRGGGNGQFNLRPTRLYKNGASQLDGGMHGGDELPPLRTNYGVIGGNHTFGFIGIADATGNLVSRIGQTCTNAANAASFLMVDYISETKIGVFVKAYKTNDSGVSSIVSEKITEGDVLTFSDGVSVPAGSVSEIEYPSINCHKYSFAVDGKETSEQKDYQCDAFEVRESYNLVSFKGIWDYYADNAHAGISYMDALNDIAGCLNVKHVYSFDEKCSMVVNTTFCAIETMRLHDCGIIQNGKIMPGETDSVYMYINKAGEVDGYDFSKLVDLTDWNSEIILTPGDAKGTCGRNVILVKKASGGLVYGFSSGFIPDMSKSKDSERASIGRLWRVSDDEKSYPVAVYNKTLTAGESMSFVAYRSFLPEEMPVTNFNIVNVGNVAYLFIDAHADGIYTVDVDAKYCNRSIEILDQSNIDIQSDVVGYSITFTVSGGHGYATLKLK